jgi:iron(III) transport system substrate-binding protein
MRSPGLTALTLLFASVLSACGGAAPQAASAAAKPAGQVSAAPLQALYEKAKVEGQVAWYGSLQDTLVKPLVQGFEAQYPGVKVDLTQNASTVIFTRIQVEQAAHKLSIDVADAAESNIGQALEGNLADSIDWAKLGVPADRILQGSLVTTRYQPHVIIYNTQQVKQADAPKTWDDLVAPRWQGKMAMDNRGSSLAAFLASPELGFDKGLEYARKIAALKPLYQPSNTAMEQLVVSGQTQVGGDILANALAAQKKGAPIEIAPVSPQSSTSTTQFVVAGAPHPAAAQLLIAWLTSPAAQDIWEAAALGSPNVNCAVQQLSLPAQALCSRQIREIALTTLDQFRQLDEFQTQVAKIFGTDTANSKS